MSKFHERIKHLIPQIVSDITNVTIDDRVKISVRCGCGKIVILGARNLVRQWNSEVEYRCKSCDVKTYVNDPIKIEKFRKTLARTIVTPAHKAVASNGGKQLWHNPAYESQRQHIKECVSADNKTNPVKIESLQKAGRTFLADPNYKNHLGNIRKLANIAYQERVKTDPVLRAEMTSRLVKALKDPISRAKRARSASIEMTKRWKDPVSRKKLIDSLNTPQNKIKLSINTKLMWQDPVYRQKMVELYSTEDYKKGLSIRAKKTLSNPIVLEKLAAKRLLTPRVSSIQKKLYSILDGLDIKCYRERLPGEGVSDQECKIAWYTFDCVIPRDGKKTLLVECQGDYWHNLPKVICRDKAKATYIARFHPECEIKYIWEHEFKDLNKVTNLVKSWLVI